MQIKHVELKAAMKKVDIQMNEEFMEVIQINN